MVSRWRRVVRCECSSVCDDCRRGGCESESESESGDLGEEQQEQEEQKAGLIWAVDESGHDGRHLSRGEARLGEAGLDLDWTGTGLEMDWKWTRVRLAEWDKANANRQHRQQGRHKWKLV
ncbi:unnamed protein product [Jaminaea pallidilutea]